MQTSKTLLCIGFVYPEPKSSAAGARIMQLLHLFLEQGYEITFGTTANPSTNTADLSTMGIQVKTLELNSDSFDTFLVELNPGVVLFDRYLTEEQFGWRVAKYCPNAIRILDTEDLHFLRHAREKNLKSKLNFSKNFLNSDIAKREISSLYRCDLTLIISEVEYDILVNELQIDPSLLFYIPFIFPSSNNSFSSFCLSFEERKDFIFIGNFLHAPNLNAVEYLKTTLWPKLSNAIPNSEIHIYGAYAKSKHLSMTNSQENFFIHGFIDNAEKVIGSARVMLAPLQFGAGLKGKIFDAMRLGTPCAMSSVAAEGIFGECLSNGFIEDDPDIFVKYAGQLYTDFNIWQQSQYNGYYVLKSRFCSSFFVKQLFNTIDYLSNNLDAHRLQNFTGILLQHNTMQSTKYLSKWIQAKNNRK